ALERALADARAGRGAIVGVRGEVGVGKSRLCEEFLAQCRQQDVGVFRIHNLSHLRGTPHMSLVSELRRMLGVSVDDPGPAVRRRVHDALSALDPGATATAPFIEHFLGVTQEVPLAIDSSDPGRFRLMLKSLFAALGRQRPMVVLVEDAHWIDAETRNLLAIALEVVAGARVLLLLTFRPEFRVPAASGYTEIDLPALGPRAANELLVRLLGDSDALADLAREIRERSNGNPLFIEELVTMLAESGALVGVRGAYRPGPDRSRTALPSSLQALLESRIDLLAPREKLVLQAASVIGRTFPVPLLRRVLRLPREEVDEAVVVLDEGGFLTPGELADDQQYAFRHPMVHEQVYASQLKDDLAKTHGEIAAASVEIDANRLDERAGSIAHHWEHAGRFHEAARWAQRAAAWIAPRNLREGMHAWQRVFALLERAPKSRESDELAIVARCRMLELGARLGMSPQDVVRVLAEAGALVERVGNPALRALLHGTDSQIRAFAGDVPAALERARAAVRAAEEAAEPSQLLGHRALLVLLLTNAGEFAEALSLADALVAQLVEHPARHASRIAAQIRLYSGKIRVLTGDPRGARQDLAVAASSAWAAGDVESLALVCTVAPTVSLILGEDAAESVVHAERAVELSEYLGNPYGRVSAYGALGLAQLLDGNARAAARVLHGALLLARDHRVGLQREATLLGYLACATLLRGETAHALSLAGEAVHVARRSANLLGESMAELARAWVLLRGSGIAAATEIEASLGRVIGIAAAKGSVSLAAIARHHLATVAGLLGDAPRQRRELERARAAFAAMGAHGWERRSERRLQGAGAR
ncbi:MAG: hypothetical protein FJ148_14890, partial [Deltaproteobacteria bacterium]|nr:hypothetical protein [Deltaproteobacteria bacterium]